MICAYNEIYLERARDILAVMFDYAVNSLELNGNDYYQIFSGSNAARQFECGNPSYIAGMSGLELTHMVLDETGLHKDHIPYQSKGRSAQYWAGWALGYYQWKNDIRFSRILDFTTFENVLLMYSKYHEMDIRHFCDQMDTIAALKNNDPNLKRLRRLAGYTQSFLAKQSDVPLRTIQQYEQRQKNINKAQAQTVLSLSRVIGCDSRDIMDSHLLL